MSEIITEILLSKHAKGNKKHTVKSKHIYLILKVQMPLYLDFEIKHSLKSEGVNGILLLS